MEQPIGKLKFAYETISNMEKTIKSLQAQLTTATTELATAKAKIRTMTNAFHDIHSDLSLQGMQKPLLDKIELVLTTATTTSEGAVLKEVE